MVPDFDVFHALADALDEASAFVSEDDGEGAFRVFAGEGEVVPTSQPRDRRVEESTDVWQIPVLSVSYNHSGMLRGTLVETQASDELTREP